MHSNENVKNALQNFILVSVDIDKQEEAAEAFGASAVPLMLFFSPDGKQKTKKLGGLRAESLITLLEKNK